MLNDYGIFQNYRKKQKNSADQGMLWVVYFESLRGLKDYFVFILFFKAVPEMRKPLKAKFRILFQWVFTLAVKYSSSRDYLSVLSSFIF